MKTNKNKSNNRIVKLLMIMALGVLTMSGCQQVNDMVNKPANTNTATNSNASANANANSNANSNTTANSNANANTSASPTNSAANSNTSASNTAANTATAPKAEVPLTEEAKAFKNNLVGKWLKSDGKEEVTFTEDKTVSKIPNEEDLTTSYRILDEKTVEFTSSGGGKATMSFEDEGNTLNWKQSNGYSAKFKRVNPK